MEDKEIEEEMEKTPESSSGGGTYVFLLLIFCVVLIPILIGGFFDFGWYHPFLWIYSLPLTVILCGLSFNFHKIWSDTQSSFGQIVVVLFNSVMIFTISTFGTYMMFFST